VIVRSDTTTAYTQRNMFDLLHWMLHGATHAGRNKKSAPHGLRKDAYIHGWFVRSKISLLFQAYSWVYCVIQELPSMHCKF
jgi:hypothetical protein